MVPDRHSVVIGAVAILALQATALSANADPSAESPDTQLVGLSHIRISSDALKAERSMAAVLQEGIQALYGVRSTISTGSDEGGAGAILLGRRMTASWIRCVPCYRELFIPPPTIRPAADVCKVSRN